MTLYINTVSHDEIIIALWGDDKVKIGNNAKGTTKDHAQSRATGAPKIIIQKKIKAPRQQAEKLVPAIAVLLKSQRLKLNDLKKIVVANRGGSFTALRIGVITANALAYALKIPVVAEGEPSKAVKKFGTYSIVEPLYDREPTIGISKKPKL
jgi:tRNA A37 threonylcarbamoyltransferase TsaD